MNKAELILSKLYENKFGESPEKIHRLPGAGSGRVYYRLSSSDKSVIGVEGENLRDCHAFICLARTFRRFGISVPEVYAVDDTGLYYIQEDLGDTSLFKIISDGKKSSVNGVLQNEMTEYIRQSLGMLAKMQTVPAEEWVDDVVYGPFSRRQVMWDLNYFKYEYLRVSGVDFDEETLEDDFERLCENLLSVAKMAEGFMYRDFQSRNIMIKNGVCRMIDFQGGRKGPVLYDVVSFLWQAKAGFSKSFRSDALNHYLDIYTSITGADADKLKAGYYLFALFRTLQVLGAYGLRGLVEKKAHFLESIPAALSNLRELIEEGILDSYPHLKKVCEGLTVDKRFSFIETNDFLTVEVFSFSYKKGYPADYTGNGGGFMFDCRGMHNPGRYEEYRQQTGMDEPVINFLKEKGETDRFSDKVVELVTPTISRYIKRGFKNLQIGFGCTGGQHRSVYCAERVSKDLARLFPEIRVKVCHREQGVERKYNR